MKNELYFNDRSKLRILQVSDPQDLKFVRKAMLRMLNNAYDMIKPDLVLFTGDNILGNHLLDRRVGSGHFAEGKEATRASMEEALSYILDPLEEREIPFAMIYGNHDDMNLLTKEEQIEIYRKYEYCMEMNTTDDSVDCDTYSIALKDNEGKTKFNLFMLDSAWQDNDGERKCHCEIKKETVEWYKKESARLRDENNGENIPSIMFMHVPLQKIFDLSEKCDADADYALKSEDGEYFRLNRKLARGFMMENPSVVTSDNGLYDAVSEENNVLAIVNGHDHLNNFIGKIDGIDFISTGCASFRCYGDRRTRGVRLFEISDDGTYTTSFFNYDDLCGVSLLDNIKYFNDADELAVKKWTTVGIAALSGAAVMTAAIIKKLKNNLS